MKQTVKESGQLFLLKRAFFLLFRIRIRIDPHWTDYPESESVPHWP